MCWWWQMIHINSNPQGRPHVVHLLHHQLPLHRPPPPPPPCYEQIIQHILHQCHPCSPYSSPSSHQPFNELALGCWQLTRSDKISDQLWSLTLNAGHTARYIVKKDTKEHSFQLAKKIWQDFFLRPTLISDAQCWRYTTRWCEERNQRT